MANFTLEIKAPELVEAINNLASAISKGSSGCSCSTKAVNDITELSDADTVKLPNGDDPKKYTMFQDLAKLAQKLRDMDLDKYEKILYKYVPKNKKYSAIEPKDWGKAIKEFKKAIKELEEAEEEVEDNIEEVVNDIDSEEDGDYYEEEVEVEEEPAYTIAEIRALAAKAKNAGVKVGAIMKKVTGVTKVSEISKDKYNTFAAALNEAMEG